MPGALPCADETDRSLARSTSLQSKSLPAMENDMADPARKYDPDPVVGQDPFNPAPTPIPVSVRIRW